MTRKKSPRQKAIELGIEALTHLRRKRYAAGNAAWEQGGLARTLDFAEGDHKKYLEYTAAIQEMETILDQIKKGIEDVQTNQAPTGKKREQREGSNIREQLRLPI